MYFAWLGMYTKWLIAPAFLGIVTFILSMRGEKTRDWCMFAFNIFNIVWATLFLEAWKRKSAELAYKWGTMDMPSEALKDPRPLFRVRYTYFHIWKLSYLIWKTLLCSRNLKNGSLQPVVHK